MKKKTQFTIFHSLIALFYIYMYLSSVYNIDSKFGLIAHGKFGFIMSIMILVVFVLFRKTLIGKFKHYFDLKSGKFEFKVFKVSVLLMILHFLLAGLSGIMMNNGINTYQYHSLSRYIVPGLLIFHLGSHIYRKIKRHSQ